MHNKLKVMPYIDHTFKKKEANDPERVNYIQKMIKDCSVGIFFFCQSESNGVSNGVMTEFREAEKKGLKIVPISSTGFAAEEIQNIFESENRIPSYLERYSDILKNKNSDEEKIVETVKSILMDINKMSIII